MKCVEVQVFAVAVVLLARVRLMTSDDLQREVAVD